MKVFFKVVMISYYQFNRIHLFDDIVYNLFINEGRMLGKNNYQFISILVKWKY